MTGRYLMPRRSNLQDLFYRIRFLGSCQQQTIFVLPQVLYPAELRARPWGKSSYCKGNPTSTPSVRNPFFTPKKTVVCTGFAVHPDSSAVLRQRAVGLLIRPFHLDARRVHGFRFASRHMVHILAMKGRPKRRQAVCRPHLVPLRPLTTDVEGVAKRRGKTSTGTKICQ